MFCKQCGAKALDGAVFCPECGTKLEAPIEVGPGVKADAAAQVNAADQPEAVPPTVNAPMNPNGNLGGGSGNRKLLVAAIVAVAVIIVAAVAFGVSSCQSEAQRTAKHPVNVTVNAAGLDTSTGTLVPLSVKGTDASGNAVDESGYFGTDSSSLSLAAGTYTFEVTASPIAADGTLYSLEGAYVEATVGEDGSLTPGDAITLKPLSADETTYQQIDDAYEAAKNGGASSAEAAEKLKDAAVKRVDEAKEKQSASQQSTSASQSSKGSSAAKSDSSSSSSSSAEGTYSGTVYVFSSDDEMAKGLGISNPNGSSSYKSASAVLKLDSAVSVTAKNGDGSGSRSGTANYILLAGGSNASSWSSYDGKHVTVSAPSLSWPSDTRMPVGEPSVVGSATVVG